jgi:hypothetical protein
MSELDFEIFVVRTILDHAKDSYLSKLAIQRLLVAIGRIAAAHQ